MKTDDIAAGLSRIGALDLRRAAYRCIAALAAAGVALLYFRAALLVLGAAVLIYRMVVPLIFQQLECKRQIKLRKDMIQWLEELTMALKAGKSLASATKELASRLTADPGKGGDGAVIAIWKHCLGMIQLNYPIGQTYRELAWRIALPEMKVLASLIGSAVRTGANLPYVFIQSASGLRERLESREVLESSLASRRMEGYLLSAAPAAYTAFLRFATPSYMEPLYAGGGRVWAVIVFALQLAGSRLFFQMLLREEAGPKSLELAAFQEEIALQLQAGLSLPEAWKQAAQGLSGDRPQKGRDGGEAADDVSGKLINASRMLAMGTPFGKVMETVRNEEGGGTELRRLAELLLRNYQAGSGSLASLLSLEAKQTRQRSMLDRQAKDSKRGTMLLFPMILLLLSALLLTAAPAMLSIQN